MPGEAPSPDPVVSGEVSDAHLQSAKKPRQNKHRGKNGKPQNAINDGSISDGALPHSHGSPVSQRHASLQQHERASPRPAHNDGARGATNVSKTRPVSIGNQNTATPNKQAIKEAAYAGATFQASPAASSLPVPKFFAKSMSGAMSKSPGPASDNISSTSIDTISQVPPGKNQNSNQTSNTAFTTDSPLDLFFKADRAERDAARRTSDSPATTKHVRLGSTPGPSMSTDRYLLRGNHAIIDDSDENESDQPSPSRNRATNHATSGPVLDHEDEARRRSQTESLKKMLMNVPLQPPTSPPGYPAHTNQQMTSPGSMHATPPPFQRSISGPSTPDAMDRQASEYQFYGNRNLSPLFKAARNESPLGPNPLNGYRPPSNLRQEVPFDQSPSTAVPWAQSPPPAVQGLHHSRQHSGPLYQQSSQGLPPAQPFTSPTNHQHSNRSAHVPQYSAYHNIYANSNGYAPSRGPTASAQGTETQSNGSIRSMEDSLRRMLKLSDGPSG